MAQTKIVNRQLEYPVWNYNSTTSVEHDYSSLGASLQHINDGTNNFSIQITLDHTADVIVEWGCVHLCNNSYGARGCLYRDTTVLDQANYFRHGQSIRAYAGNIYIDENLSAGTHTFSLKVAASGSISTIVRYENRFMKIKLIDI